MFQLQTSRLLLRDLLETDWQTIYRLSSEPSVRKWLDFLPEPSEAECRDWTATFISHNNERPRFSYNLCIVRRDDEEPIGWIGWGRPSDQTFGDVDFGYAIFPENWNNGYMSEAFREVLSFIFSHRDVDTVFGECDAPNLGSARVMEKSGLRLVARWEEERPDGKRHGMHRYLVTRSQWVMNDA